jgi:hypothetical protein
MPRKPPMPKPSTTRRTGRSADAMAGAAAAKKSKPRGTADSIARRSGKQWGGADTEGIPSKNKGTGPDYQYHVTGSRTTRPNAGKRISEKRSESGVRQEYFSSAPNDSQFVAVKSRRNTSDAIVKPTIKKKASTRPTPARAKKR